ncbi:MAG: CusA/CzcA family heavy metal efflux RND transporter [Pseudomonadota bacterium]
MLDGILTFSLRNRAAVVLFALLAIVAGVGAFRGLTVEAFPDPTDTQVNVITLVPGQPAEEIERQVGLPLERALNGMPGLSRLRNLSLFGLSFVTLTFDDGVDAYFARQQTIERLRSAELPDGVVAELGPLATPIGEVFRYTLEGAGGDPMALRSLQEWTVRPRLLRVPGVAEVVSYGGLVKEIQVQPSPARLAAFDLQLEDLERALREASANASGGTLEHGAEQFVIRSTALFSSLADVETTRVATHEGTPVFVRDVATIRQGWAPRQGVVSRGTDFDAVEGIVLMRRGQNPSIVLRALREAMGALQLPKGVAIHPFYDRTELVGTTLRTVAHNLIDGAMLVVLVLFVFLLDLRAALIVGAVIPLSLLSAFIYLRARGMSANLLSMGAVDFGIIVDGAVVIVESIVHRVSQTPASGRQDLEDRVASATRAVLRPTVFALLIIIAAYLPIFLLERVEGRIFAPMANTVVAALVGALVFSVSLVPVLATFAYRRPRKHVDSPVLRVARALYVPLLRRALRQPVLVLLVAGGSLAAALFAVPHLGSEFLPELNEGSLYVTCTLPSNISLTEGRKLVPRITALFDSFPEVDEVLSQLGRPEDGTDATLTNNLEFFVKLKAPGRWPTGVRSISDVIKRMEPAMATVPGIEVNFSQPIRDNVNENISGQFGQVAVKVYGDDLTVLQAYAEKVKGVIADVAGVADLGIVKSGEVPQIQVRPDRESLARYGLDVGDFQRIFQAAVGGVEVGTFWEGEIRRDLVLRFPEVARDDVEKIRKLPIAVGGGVTVPLETLSTVELGVGRASINRENGRRYIGIRMNVRGRDLGSFVVDAQAAVARHAPTPTGISIEWGGEFENKQRAMARLALVVPIALVLTLGLLFNAFRGLGLALLTLANVPFALVGGVAGLAVAHMPLSVAAVVGFIALIGQASLNGVLVLSAIDEARRGGVPRQEAILRGCVDRLRAVLMTGALAALGLVPAAVSRAMGSETQRPIAVVIVGGTLSAALLTLVVLPVMYDLAFRVGVLKQKTRNLFANRSTKRERPR